MQQLSFEDFTASEAARRRDIGIVEAEFAETLTGSSYCDAVYAAICHVARRQCEVHIDHVLRIVKVRPTHPNANGAPWLRAIKDGTILKSDSDRFRPCESDTGKHRHQYRVYRSGLFRGRVA
jgi:hypothetical protein